MVGSIAWLLSIYLIAALMIRNRLLTVIAAFVILLSCWDVYWCTRWGGFRLVFGYAALFFLLLYACKARRFFIFFSGVLAALEFFSSYDQGVFCYLTAAAYLFADAGARSGVAVSRRAAVSYLSGNVLVFAMFGFFLAATSSGGAFLAELRFILQRTQFLTSDPGFMKFNHQMITPAVCYLIAGYYLYRKLLLAPRPVDAGVSRILGLMALSIYGLLVYLYGFRYVQHALRKSAYGLCAVVVFILLDQTWHSWVKPHQGKKFATRFTILSLVLVGACFSLTAPSYWPRKIKSVYEQTVSDLRTVNPAIVRLRGSRLPAWQVDEIEKVASLVERYCQSNERLLCFPNISFFNFICDRLPADRFYTPLTAFQNRVWARQLLADCIQAKPPVAILRVNRGMLDKFKTCRRQIGGIEHFVHRRYHLALRSQTVEVWVRKDRWRLPVNHVEGVRP
ncbi:MAG: hypothetical protein WCG06_00125 [Candidatus Omnitrophota bacterium]